MVNIGARNDSYGEGLAGTFSDAWEAKGGKIGESVLYDPEQPSYDSEARQIVSGNPDTIVIIDFPETFANVGPALVRTGDYDPANAWGTDGLTIGPVKPPEIVAGMQATAPGSPDTGAVPEAFEKVFADSDPADVEQAIFAAQNFDAVMLCYLAAVAAGSTDGQEMADQVRDVSGPPGDKLLVRGAPGAIEALQNGDDIDYEGAAGRDRPGRGRRPDLRRLRHQRVPTERGAQGDRRGAGAEALAATPIAPGLSSAIDDVGDGRGASPGRFLTFARPRGSPGSASGRSTRAVPPR